jgi:hypothetical protein
MKTSYTHHSGLLLAAAAFACLPATLSAQESDVKIKDLIAAASKMTASQIGAPSPTLPASGQGPLVPLTLDEAVKFALDRNLDIAVQRLNPQLQDIAIASARTVFSPVLSSNVNRQAITSTPTNQTQAATGGLNKNNTFTYNAGISKLMPWGGGELGATFNNNRQASNNNFSTFNPSFNSTWTFDYTQPLLRGFRIDQQRQTLSVARINRDISEVQRRRSTWSRRKRRKPRAARVWSPPRTIAASRSLRSSG